MEGVHESLMPDFSLGRAVAERGLRPQARGQYSTAVHEDKVTWKRSVDHPFYLRGSTKQIFPCFSRHTSPLAIKALSDRNPVRDDPMASVSARTRGFQRIQPLWSWDLNLSPLPRTMPR